MGQSTNAIIGFGFPLDEDVEYPWMTGEFEHEFDAWWAAQNGCVPPQAKYSDDSKPEYCKYWDAKRELEKTCMVEIDRHCSADYPMYMLCIRGTIRMAYRGSPEDLGEGLPVMQLGSSLKEFCERYKIPYKVPSWYLYSDWC